MKQFGMLLRRCIAFPLFGQDVEQHRSVHGFCAFQKGNESLRIMTVNRSQIGKAHILKNSAGYQHLPQAIFQTAGEPKDSFSSRDMGHKAAVPLLHTQILFLCPQL